MTNQSPSWMRSLARKAASSSTSSSASTATSSTTASATSGAATSTTASAMATATSACSATSTSCPRSAGWSAETSEVHCSDTLITHFLILDVVECVLATESESDQPVDQLVESPYVHHDSRDENDHNACVSHQLMSGRTDDLAQLVQDLTDEQGNRPEEPSHRVASTGAITACATGASGAGRTRLGHSSSSLRRRVHPRATARQRPHRTSLSDQTLCHISLRSVAVR